MNRRQILSGLGAVTALGAGATYLALSSTTSSTDYELKSSELRRPLEAAPSSWELVRFATLAPNGHNAQPWLFRIADRQIVILPDLARRTPVVDPDDHHLFVSLGCAAENLALASAARGAPGNVGFKADDDGSVVFDFEPGPAISSPLFDAINVRQSTRADYDGRSVGTADLATLAEAAAAVPGVDLVLLTDRGHVDRLRDLVLAGNETQMADAAFVRELKAWLRFNSRQALRSGDGLYSLASGSPAMPGWLGPTAFDFFSTTQAQNDAYARQIRSSAGIAVFVGAGEKPADWVAVGRACQRFALQATALGLKHAFVNQPVEVAGLRPELAVLIGMPARRPDVVMRFGYGPQLPWSPRRSVDAVVKS